jgi:hypothetical protein
VSLDHDSELRAPYPFDTVQDCPQAQIYKIIMVKKTVNNVCSQSFTLNTKRELRFLPQSHTSYQKGFQPAPICSDFFLACYIQLDVQ